MSRVRRSAGCLLLAGALAAGGGGALALAPAASAASTSDVVAASMTTRVVPAWPAYNRGDRGPNVRTIQFLLRNFSSATRFLAADGIFGPQTAQAVRLYKESRGLPVDGIVGTRTWDQLTHEFGVARGDRGPDVKAAQVQLRKNGYRITIDGVFGPRTEGAVRAAQQRYGLTVNGVVDATTWRALVTRHN